MTQGEGVATPPPLPCARRGTCPCRRQSLCPTHFWKKTTAGRAFGGTVLTPAQRSFAVITLKDHIAGSAFIEAGQGRYQPCSAWKPRSPVLGRPTQTAGTGRSSCASAASGEWTPEAGDKLYCNLRVAASSANLISAAAKASHPAGSTVA